MLKIKISAPHVHGSACGCEHMEEEQKPNPWAICTAQVGREDKEKYEDCVLGVKEKHGIKKEEKEMKITKKQLKQIIQEEIDAVMSELEEKKEEDWIQGAEEDIEKRGTEGVCTGEKFGSESCPPGSKRYNLAKTFRKMAKDRKAKE